MKKMLFLISKIAYIKVFMNNHHKKIKKKKKKKNIKVKYPSKEKII